MAKQEKYQDVLGLARDKHQYALALQLEDGKTSDRVAALTHGYFVAQSFDDQEGMIFHLELLRRAIEDKYFLPTLELTEDKETLPPKESAEYQNALGLACAEQVEFFIGLFKKLTSSKQAHAGIHADTIPMNLEVQIWYYKEFCRLWKEADDESASVASDFIFSLSPDLKEPKAQYLKAIQEITDDTFPSKRLVRDL